MTVGQAFQNVCNHDIKYSGLFEHNHGELLSTVKVTRTQTMTMEQDFETNKEQMNTATAKVQPHDTPTLKIIRSLDEWWLK